MLGHQPEARSPTNALIVWQPLTAWRAVILAVLLPTLSVISTGGCGTGLGPRALRGARPDYNLVAATAPDVSPFTRAAALNHVAMFEMFSGNPWAAQVSAGKLHLLSLEHGYRFWSAMALAVSGWASARLGDVQKGIADLESAREAIAETGARMLSTYVLAFLAEARLRAGHPAAGLRAATEGLELAETTLDRSYWPELWRLKGELLRAAPGGGAAAEGEECLRRAVALARMQGSRSLELRAATSLARALRARGQIPEARRELGKSCRTWGAAVTSHDLDEARALLADLASKRPAAGRRRPSGSSHRHR